jgi:GNAT superfamily N-acetyltransferase
MSVIIREILKSEINFLDEMLYQAIFIPEGIRKLPKEIIYNPELHHYIKNFGRKDDYCLVVESDGVLIGAIWSRIFSAEAKGYGWVDEKTPEISLAVDENFRKKGVGSLLLESMIEKLKEIGYEQISLSVDIVNFAYSMYKKFGFVDFELTDKSSVMIKKLK